jgi:hypothetical protein
MRLAARSFVFALVMTLLPEGQASAAVPGYDSSFTGETAFIATSPGQTGSFMVFFMNTGTETWVKGTSSQVNLAICRNDKTTCNVFSPQAGWNDGSWLSSIAYATTTQDRVASGQVASFTYSFKVPLGAARGTYHFNGDLVLARTLNHIHAEGYYQDASISGDSGN